MKNYNANINLENLRTCVCGASKQIAREKTNIKKVISEMNQRRQNLINRERKLNEKELQFSNFKESYAGCEEELKKKESELNNKIDKLNEN